MNIRIGYGYDVHALAENESLILGGINIPHNKGTIAHSDGDVLIHAICDALLGAANMRDIGFHFPDNSDAYKNVDSKLLLGKTVQLLKDAGYGIGNIDTTICLQQPKLKNHIPEMQQALANTMNITVNDIAIKATTTEQLGFEGREEGVSVHAVVLIHKQEL